MTDLGATMSDSTATENGFSRSQILHLDPLSGRNLVAMSASGFFSRLKTTPRWLLEKWRNWLGVRTQPEITQNWSLGASLLRGSSPALPEIHFQKAFTKLQIKFHVHKLCKFKNQLLYFVNRKSYVGIYIYVSVFIKYTFRNCKHGPKITYIVILCGFSAFQLGFMGLYKRKVIVWGGIK